MRRQERNARPPRRRRRGFVAAAALLAVLLVGAGALAAGGGVPTGILSMPGAAPIPADAPDNASADESAPDAAAEQADPAASDFAGLAAPTVPAQPEDAFFTQLDAGFAATRVTDSASALQAIEVAGGLGLDDPTSELAPARTDEALGTAFYRFSQTYRGVPVYARGATVSADDVGTVRGLTANVQPIADAFSVEPAVGEADAARTAAAQVTGGSAGAGALTVYTLHETDPVLAWCFDVVSAGDAQRVFVDAQTGGVVATLPRASQATVPVKIEHGTVEADLESAGGDTYRLSDPMRRLTVADAGNQEVEGEFLAKDAAGTLYGSVTEGGVSHLVDAEGNRLAAERVQDRAEGESPISAVDGQGVYRLKRQDGTVATGSARLYADVRLTAGGSELAPVEGSAASFKGWGAKTKANTLFVNLGQTLDFYDEVLHRRGFDGEDGAIRAVASAKLSASADEGNAITMSFAHLAVLLFGADAPYSLDVTAHELTHATENAISGVEGAGEPGALKEATSDIMGEAVEDFADDGSFNGSCDWTSADVRDARDPAASAAGALPERYQGDRWASTDAGAGDHGGVHTNCTVITHAAYLMCEGDLAGEALTTDQVARLVYLGFFSMPSTCTFAQYRAVIENAASVLEKRGILTADQAIRVSAAFDAVGVGEPDAPERAGVDGTADATADAAADAAGAMKRPVDVALVLDASESMAGQPVADVRAAAGAFADAALEGDDVRVGIVSYNEKAQVRCPLTSDARKLRSAAASLDAGGNTNIDAGVAAADALLGSAGGRERVIVLMSDGAANEGRTGDDLVEVAAQLRARGTRVYTVGFNEGADGYALLSRMPDAGCHYEIKGDADLAAFFRDVADMINGMRFMYVRVACPVDVEVDAGGETLSSADSDQGASLRASFGSLTFEDELDADGDVAEENAVKVLRLAEGAPYEVRIRGTGTGSMDYSIAFMDDQGAYADVRTFDGIEVQEGTAVDTVAERAETTRVSVDADGDGHADYLLEAGAGEGGHVVEESPAADAPPAAPVAGAAALIAAGAIGILIRVRRRRRQQRAA